MARAILSPLLSSLSGKLGNSVFTSYKGIQIVREMPLVVTNPSSAAQVLARAGFSSFGAAWRVLTQSQRAPWEHLGRTQFDASTSASNTGSNPLIAGPKGPLSGYNAFIQVNMNRLMSGLAPLGQVKTDAPLGLPPPPPLKTFSAAQVGGNIEVTWTTISTAPTTNRIEIWITSIGAKIHRQLIYTGDAVPNATVIISQVRGVSGLLISPPPGTYKVQAQVVNNEGLASVPSELLFVYLIANFNLVFIDPRVLILNLAGISVSVPWTAISLAAYIPANAHSILAYMELDNAVINHLCDAAIFRIRRDATQGACMQRQARTDTWAAVLQKEADSGIIPITSTREIEYLIDMSQTPPLILGFISAINPVPPAGGNGYTLLDVLFLQDGDNAASVQVDAVDDGEVLTIDTVPTTPGDDYEIDDVLSLQDGDNNAAVNVDTIEAGEVLTVDLTPAVQGDDYTVNDVLTITDGDNNATVQVDSVNAGEVQTIDITPFLGGVDYWVDDILFLNAGDFTASVRVVSIDGSGAVTEVELLTGGHGYSNITYDVTGGHGTGCQVTVLVVSTTGPVLTVSLLSAGLGYTTGTKTTTGGTGLGCNIEVLTVSTSGPVTAVHLLSGGIGYSTGIKSTAGGHGTNCEINVLTISNTGPATAVSLLTNGSGYTTGIKNTTGGTGTNCTVEITVVNSETPSTFNARIYLLGYFY